MAETAFIFQKCFWGIFFSFPKQGQLWNMQWDFIMATSQDAVVLSALPTWSGSEVMERKFMTRGPLFSSVGCGGAGFTLLTSRLVLNSRQENQTHVSVSLEVPGNSFLYQKATQNITAKLRS